MRLARVKIAGYRSITTELDIHIEPNATVVLGANDHGKTNLLEAIAHLNDEAEFDPDNDLSWDLSECPADFPSIRWTLELDEDERNDLLQCENAEREESSAGTASQPTPSDDDETSVPADEDSADADEATGEPPETDASDDADDDTSAAIISDADAETSPDPEHAPTALVNTQPNPVEPLIVTDMPTELTLTRRGVEGGLKCIDVDQFHDSVVSDFVRRYKPRVEMIAPWNELSDAVTADELQTNENEFMRGIFYYAGLDPDNSSDLFAQSDATQMRLEKASIMLNQTLKQSWSQGEGLDFVLRHYSQSQSIELLIHDPAVQNRYVRASRRSSGFTHYFAMKTILHARQQANQANSYILLFDEPGIYLHPLGQYDMLQVLETLGKTNQLLYVTHSLFMINKAFPTRHRLLIKEEAGTRIDGKPYVGRWGSVLSSLGLSLTGSILFANYVVLCEGDADPILIQGVLQKLIDAGKSSIDLNAVSFISTGQSQHADVLIRLLSETSPHPQLGVLFDGDGGGKARFERIKRTLESQDISSKHLVKDTAIEDYLPLPAELYVEALARYVTKLIVDRGDPPPDAQEFVGMCRDKYQERFGTERLTTGLASWAVETGKDIGGLDSYPSKVGIAREYVILLADTPNDDIKTQDISRVVSLVDWMCKHVEVPQLSDVSAEIFE